MNMISHRIEEEVRRALSEDLGAGDVTADLISNEVWVRAELISREPMCLAGQPWATLAFQLEAEQLTLNWHYQDGDFIPSPAVLCEVRGPAKLILSRERTALNFLQTLSATATQTHHFVERLRPFNTQVLDTRKTLPGLRDAQKYAVRCGGGVNHRIGLYDAYLIKENHIRAYGSITKVIAAARQKHPELFLEIEVENLLELKEALVAGPDRIMLDNFSQEMLLEAVAMNTPKICPLEVSGGIELDNLEALGRIGVDCVSVGALTKSIRAIDLSLLVRETLG